MIIFFRRSSRAKSLSESTASRDTASFRERAPRGMAPHCTQDLGQVAKAIAPFAKTPDFMRYGENVQKTPIQARHILPHRKMWRAVASLH